MCATCGCSGDSVNHPHDHRLSPAVRPSEGARLVRLEQEVLGKNDKIAAQNRAWLAERRILALNLTSSPGAGKTTLLERTIRELGREIPICVIEGDQETPLDAERIRAAGCSAIRINTGRGCHLDAAMVGNALQSLAPPPRSLVFIENVGNLVCPAMFDLGEHAKVVIASPTEGEDKPLKYPHMFRASALMLLNKIDLLPYLSFDPVRCVAYAKRVNPRLEVAQVSATRGDGIENWYSWIRAHASHP